MDKKIIERDYADAFKSRKENYWNSRFPGGESYAEVYDRIVEFYNKYKDEPNMIIVTHGAGVRFLKNILTKAPKEDAARDKANQNYFYGWDGKKLEKL